MTANGLTLTVTFRVPCGYRSHDASITLTAWGAMEFLRLVFPLKWLCFPRPSENFRIWNHPAKSIYQQRCDGWRGISSLERLNRKGHVFPSPEGCAGKCGSS
jgi:hypothetical protein